MRDFPGHSHFYSISHKDLKRRQTTFCTTLRVFWRSYWKIHFLIKKRKDPQDLKFPWVSMIRQVPSDSFQDNGSLLLSFKDLGSSCVIMHCAFKKFDLFCSFSEQLQHEKERHVMEKTNEYSYIPALQQVCSFASSNNRPIRVLRNVQKFIGNTTITIYATCHSILLRQLIASQHKREKFSAFKQKTCKSRQHN